MGALQSQDAQRDTCRVVWRWEYLPNVFDPYPPEISTIIERHFLSNFSDPFVIDVPNSISHIIDLTHMVQTDVHTQHKRRLTREITQDPRTYVLWSWENDSGEMETYSPENSRHIEVSYNRRDINFTHVLIGGKEYWIDMKNLWQISASSMKKRRIERNVIPDHKFVWQWQADDGKFLDYSDVVSRKIENDYFLRPDYPLDVTSAGRRYFVDIKRMCETNEIDGKERPIRRLLENYIRYKWLWKDELDKWHTFSPYLVGKFEENYLDPSLGLFTIMINHNEFEIDTNAMMERCVLLGRVYKLKRQALPNDFAVWGWSTKPGTFKTFPPSASKLIEAHYILNDPSPLNLKVQTKQYEIDIRARIKINSTTQGQKALERKMISINFPPNLDLLPKTECSAIFKFLAQNGHLPIDWDSRQKEEVQQFQASDSEWNMLSEKLYMSMNSEEWIISGLHRLQNVLLMNSFLLNKMILRLCHHSLEEPELLFYISNKEDNIDSLWTGEENPLEGHFSPRDDYGKGYYFTKSVKVCKEYAWQNENGVKTVICFWVLLGKVATVKPEDSVSVLYNNKYRAWSEVTQTPARADCSKVVVDGEKIFIVYSAEQCYPLYIMEFNETN